MFSQWIRTVRVNLTLRSPHVAPLAWILGAVVLANGAAVAHVVTTNPLVVNAWLVPPTHGLLPGVPYIDPNAGYTTQALGHLAALDWLHGHIPWWNPFEGVGAPLAGEMQSGAFFPPTLLLAFHQGMLLLQLFLEIVTGWSTYFLVRRLGVGRSFATAAGVAFGLCGTYAWLAHAPIRPVALLPLSLIGVERAVEAARAGRRGGWALLAGALALSILAGFPETTFLDGLLVVWWAILRLVGPGRAAWRPILLKLGTAGLVGLALCAPLVAAFTNYLSYGNLETNGSGFANAAIPSAGLVQTILPYALGPIFGFHAVAGTPDVLDHLWGATGGFLSVTLIAAGLVGLVGKRQRLLRLGLGAWVALWLLRTFGYPPVLHAVGALPGLQSLAFFRYADPSWELAVVVLAAFGLDDIARSLTRRRVLVAGAVLTGILATWAAITAWPLLTGVVSNSGSTTDHPHVYTIVSLALAWGVLAVLVLGGTIAGRRARILRSAHSADPARADIASDAVQSAAVWNLERSDRVRRRGRMVMAGIVAAESVALLGFTYLSAPEPTPLQLGSVVWLQQHLGAQRFYTLGPIQPDYGSYYGIGEADVNDLPIPRSWNQFVETRLDPNALVGSFTALARIDPSGPTAAQELTTHLAEFESIGVRYVVETANGLDIQGQPFPAAGTPPWPLGPRLVYRDTFAEIWELPTAAPVFSVTPATPSGRVGAGATLPECAATGSGSDEVTVDCPRPSTLVRRVQFAPGWSATVNGTPAPVVEDRGGPPGLFQAVSLPAGRSTIRFTYLPPDEAAAAAVAVLALLVLVGSLVVPWWSERRRSEGPGSRDRGRRPDPAGHVEDSGHV